MAAASLVVTYERPAYLKFAFRSMAFRREVSLEQPPRRLELALSGVVSLLVSRRSRGCPVPRRLSLSCEDGRRSSRSSQHGVSVALPALAIILSGTPPTPGRPGSLLDR